VLRMISSLLFVRNLFFFSFLLFWRFFIFYLFLFLYFFFIYLFYITSIFPLKLFGKQLIFKDVKLHRQFSNIDLFRTRFIQIFTIIVNSITMIASQLFIYQ